MIEESIFHAALERTDPAERAAFLKDACAGDDRLRRRVEGLLRAHETATGFLEPISPDVAGQEHDPIAAAPTLADSRDAVEQPEHESTRALARDAQNGSTCPTSRPIAEGPGTRIGPYTLVEKIGEGGMGFVYMAEQETPVRRKVALKIIKPGMDTEQVVARFEAERQALALMDHPNIAKVLDAGATESGRPYFVMELVGGAPITEYCDQNHSTPRERLELFIAVCRAIQHAHQKGIIHRDLKPANVLVTLHDGRPVPKVIDFGIAKAIGQQLTERTFFTQFGAVVGTLEYMSPEQAERSALDIDTRTDIYSLGVLLYELLTGSTPLTRESLGTAAYLEILRRIREEEPPKPSARLSDSRDALPSISAQRRMEPARLTKVVRGDLDWIVMKALEKDRTRRYETANGFARDVQRYLDGDPVEACPPSAAYKVKKLARKHRVALATIAAFALLLVAATAVSASLAIWANRERIRAVKAEDAAKEQKTRAEEREEMAIDAVKRFGDVIRETAELKNEPALAPLRARLLKEPQAFFKRLRDRLQADKATTSVSLDRLASASYDLGLLTYEMGDKEDALRAFGESLAICERLARDSRQFQSGVAASHNFIGILQSETGRPMEALASYEEARTIRERLARDNPAVIRFQSDLADNHNNIGKLLSETGRTAEALASCEQARTIRQRLARDNPAVAKFQSDLAASHNNIANLQREMGRLTEALDSQKQALAICARLACENPAVTQFQSALAGSHSNIGILQSELGRTAEALASLEQAGTIRARLARENRAVTQFQRDLAANYNNIGNLQRELGRPEEALVSYAQVRTICARLARENPAVTQFQSDLARSQHNIGLLQREAGRLTEALASYEQACTIRARLARDNPAVTQFQSDLAESHNNIGNLQYAEGRLAEALASHEQVRTVRERLARNDPAVPQFQSELALSHYNVGILQREMGRLADALASYERARTIQARLVRDHPEAPEFASELGATLNNMALIENGQREFAKAHAKIAEAIEWQRKALAAKPHHAKFRQFLANHLTNMIEAANALGRGDEAAHARRELDALRDSDPRIVALDARLIGVLDGKEAPRDETERLQLAHRAYEKSLHAASARLFAKALANDSKLAANREAQHRYNAACAAALAGCGRGKDDPAPNTDARTTLRRQAREWLQAELAAWAAILTSGKPELKANVAPILQHWKADADLVGIRDENELAKLPENERNDHRALWSSVDDLLKKAQKAAP
jgi:serine/threonine protein kinase